MLARIYNNSIKILINPREFFLKLENVEKPFYQVLKSIVHYSIFCILFIFLVINKKFFGFKDFISDEVIQKLFLTYIIAFFILFVLIYLHFCLKE